jgi:cephalosporin hydroxylase/SAM-dependent methyltransferase
VSTAIRSPRSYDLHYYLSHKAEGLDLLSYGLWQQRYGRWLVESLGLRGQRVLDIGCACGGILKGLLAAGADVDGVDCSEDFIQLGRRQWPELAHRLRICDAADLHLIADGAYDWLHASMVAEHWPPGLVPHILRELQRVVRPGGRFLCLYESETGALPGGRDPRVEPTHLCLQSPAWWTEQLAEAGWMDETSDFVAPLSRHPESFFGDYTWSWFVGRRAPDGHPARANCGNGHSARPEHRQFMETGSETPAVAEPPSVQDAFHRWFYESGLHGQTYYHGIEAHKCPLDLWVFQEILHEVRPALVIELGTYIGGTTLFLAHQLDQLGTGRVLTIDCRDLPRPAHPRIEYRLGDTHDAGVQAAARDAAQSAGGPVLVIHDADHKYVACLADLRDYGPLVTPGSYLIVEDTNVNGHPVLAEWGPGPYEAVAQFLSEAPDFETDVSREKYGVSYNPGGYLRRQS